ncbi:low-density lipoprotein receptor-like [Anolis carolinensis]|uniref:low-density lipoprotein receptor-like n=1 Tax=Anolis carolinensis TaxID=28377 RepID=UPI002F2B2766
MGRWLLPFLFFLAAAEAEGSQCANVGQFRCADGVGPCLSSGRLCDGRRDCADGSDEAEERCAFSSSFCREDEFRCSPGAECYPRAFLCDRHPDCPDGGDERGCAAQETDAPATTEKTQTEALDDLENTAHEHWVILTIVALLVLAAAVLVVSLPRPVSRDAKSLLLRFRLDQASEEELMRKEQP